jgi:hypothetical protein
VKKMVPKFIFKCNMYRYALGVEAMIAPGMALARGATLGAVVSSALYTLFNKIAPPARVGSDGGASYSYGKTSTTSSAASGGGPAMRVIAADGGVTYVDDIIQAEYTEAAEAEGVSQAMGSGPEAKVGLYKFNSVEQ